MHKLSDNCDVNTKIHSQNKKNKKIMNKSSNYAFMLFNFIYFVVSNRILDAGSLNALI